MPSDARRALLATAHLPGAFLAAFGFVTTLAL
jgi:hypothetical protein